VFFDPLYFLFALPPFLLGLYAQYKVKSSYAAMSQVPARMSGAEAARRMLDSAGLQGVDIEMVPGQLSDHYDPSARVVRLSYDVFNGHSMAAVGVACHEAGHALQHAQSYAPLVIRNAAVPLANFGSNIGMFMLMAGALAGIGPLIYLGIAGFAATVFFQVVNLPVEFNASSRAREQLVFSGIISDREEPYVAKVLNAAALTYVAATLQAIMTLLYLLLRFAGGSRDE
jgi:Zn-dependent membrane protease YugP